MFVSSENGLRWIEFKLQQRWPEFNVFAGRMLASVRSQ